MSYIVKHLLFEELDLIMYFLCNGRLDVMSLDCTDVGVENDIRELSVTLIYHGRQGIEHQEVQMV